MMWRRRLPATTAASRRAGQRSSTTWTGSPTGTTFPGWLPWTQVCGEPGRGHARDRRQGDHCPSLRRPLKATLGHAFLDVVRAHPHVENRPHWVLDVVLDEDRPRARKDHGAENLARLRRLAINICRADQDKGATRGKLERATREDAGFLQLLAAARCDSLGGKARVVDDASRGRSCRVPPSVYFVDEDLGSPDRTCLELPPDGRKPSRKAPQWRPSTVIGTAISRVCGSGM